MDYNYTITLAYGYQQTVRRGDILQKAVPAENQESSEKRTYDTVY